MLKIYGRKTSSNVQAVMWAIAEMGLSANRIDVGGSFGGNDTSDFLAMNPMGRVPVLVDGGLKMFESQAILRYLAARSGKLMPSDPADHARADQWMEWAKVNVYPVLTYKLFWQLVRTSAADRDRDAVAAGEFEIARLMEMAETQIAQHGWLAGPEMSLADISFGTGLFRYYEVPFKRADFPALKAYYKRLCSRAAYAENVMISYESLQVPDA